MTVVLKPFYSQLRFVLCRRYFLMNIAIRMQCMFMLCDKGRSRLFNWCSFLKYDALTLQIFWTARCENREICEYLLFFKPKKKHEDRGTVCNIHLHSKLLHNINNAMCHCKQFNTILMLNSLVLIRKMSLCTLSIHKEQGQML